MFITLISNVGPTNIFSKKKKKKKWTPNRSNLNHSFILIAWCYEKLHPKGFPNLLISKNQLKNICITEIMWWTFLLRKLKNIICFKFYIVLFWDWCGKNFYYFLNNRQFISFSSSQVLQINQLGMAMGRFEEWGLRLCPTRFCLALSSPHLAWRGNFFLSHPRPLGPHEALPHPKKPLFFVNLPYN